MSPLPTDPTLLPSEVRAATSVRQAAAALSDIAEGLGGGGPDGLRGAPEAVAERQLGELRDALASGDPTELVEWFDVDLTTHFSQLGPPPSGLARWAGRLGHLNTALLLAPLLVTWIGLQSASSGYVDLVASDPSVSGQPFFALWQDGFAGSSVTFGTVALAMMLSLMLLLGGQLAARLIGARLDEELRTFDSQLSSGLLLASRALTRARAGQPASAALAESVDALREASTETHRLLAAIHMATGKARKLVEVQIEVLERTPPALAGAATSVERATACLDRATGSLAGATDSLSAASSAHAGCSAALAASAETLATTGRDLASGCLRIDDSLGAISTELAAAQRGRERMAAAQAKSLAAHAAATDERLAAVGTSIAAALAAHGDAAEVRLAAASTEARHAQAGLVSGIRSANSDLADALRATHGDLAESTRLTHAALAEAIRAAHGDLAEAIRAANTDLGQAIRAANGDLASTLATDADQLAGRLDAAHARLADSLLALTTTLREDQELNESSLAATQAQTSALEEIIASAQDLSERIIDLRRGT